MKSKTWIQTYTGKVFDLADVRPDDIDIMDIAHALGNLCRFTGHTQCFYSVAEHSVRCAEEAPKDLRRAVLLHDAHEAYCSDLSSPLKRCKELEGYAKIEEMCARAVAWKFQLDWPPDPRIKEIDLRMLATEARDLFLHSSKSWDLHAEPYERQIEKVLYPLGAKQAFLDLYKELCDG